MTRAASQALPHDVAKLQLPPRSRLLAYVLHVRAMANDGPALWQHENPEVRRIGARELYEQDRRFCALPAEFVRDEIIVPMLLKIGMPAGPREPWLNAFIENYTYLFQMDDLRENPEPVRPTVRPGRPAKDILVRGLVWGAYLDAVQQRDPSDSDNAVCERVTKRLGPGLNRSFVYRIARDWRRRLGSKDETVKLAVLSAAKTYSSFMRELDEAERAARKSISRPGLLSNMARAEG